MSRRPRVLVMVHPDGFVEVYHDRGKVQLKMVEVPLGPDLEVERLVEIGLGRYWCQMFWPSKRRGLAQPNRLTMKEREDKAVGWGLVQCLREELKDERG